METIPLPEKPKYLKGDENSAEFEIKGCYPGYGNTLGNSLRRVLLSSLPGYAVTKVKFRGADHEFTTIPGVKENLVQIILNIKKLRFIIHEGESIKVKLKTAGKKTVKGSSLKMPSNIELINKDSLIATMTDSKAKLEIEMTVEKGIGYSPAEEREEKEKEIGTITIDTLFSPIVKINYRVENMRVGRRTDFDKINLYIETDGSVKPEEAFKSATEILIRQFSALAEADQEKIRMEVENEMLEEEKAVEEREKILEERTIEKKKTERDSLKINIEGLNLPNRIVKILKSNGISTLEEIKNYSEEDLGKIEGMGKKGIKEIKKVIGALGLILGN